MQSNSAANPTPTERAQARLAAMSAALGDAEASFPDDVTDQPVHVFAFGRDFVEDCDNDAESDEGFVLVTSGMSDHIQHDGEDGPDRVELLWYVRELDPRYVAALRWLAKLPSSDRVRFGSGLTVPMPSPPLAGCPMRTFLLLTPIVATDRDLFDDAEHIAGTETLCVHLLHDPEYAIKKGEDGLDQLFDLFDQGGYPLVFDPKRPSLA